jgi:hypothetical protein
VTSPLPSSSLPLNTDHYIPLSARDVIFELIGPDGTNIDVGKWPDTTVQSETGVLRTVRPSKAAKAARSLKSASSTSNGNPNAIYGKQDVHPEFIAYSPTTDVKAEASEDELQSPLHRQLSQQKPINSQETSDSPSLLIPPPPGKKWSRRSSPDRIFMNQALNDLLRTAGMPIPRQKDDTSRLPWSSIPLFLAQHGLYITNFPEANLPWVYSVENIQAKNREDWIDRVDWKSSPSQRAYKGLVAALRRGEIQIKCRPEGRDVIFEVKDAEGRTYDSTLGLSDAWRQLNMYGEGRKVLSVPSTAGASGDGLTDEHRAAMGRLEDEYEMLDLEERGSDSTGEGSGSGPHPIHRHHHTNGNGPSPRHNDNGHPVPYHHGRRHGGGSPPSSSWPPTAGYSHSQAHPSYSGLGRPQPQQPRLSGSPLSYHPTVNDPEFMSRGRPHHTDHTSLARYHLSSSNSRRGTPYSRHSSPKFNGADGIVDLPPLDLGRGEREIQREKEEIGYGHGLGTALPPIKDPQQHHNVKLETGDRLLSPPYSPPAARFPPVLQDREYERDRESRRDRDEDRRDSEAAYNTPPRTASHTSGPSLPPRLSRRLSHAPVNPHPPNHNQTPAHTQPNPTHLPHPQGSSTPFWSPPEKTWKLSLTPELLGSLPPVSHPDIYWDTTRGRWILVSGAEAGGIPPAYWSISQGAWVLDFTGGLGLRD